MWDIRLHITIYADSKIQTNIMFLMFLQPRYSQSKQVFQYFVTRNLSHAHIMALPVCPFIYWQLPIGIVHVTSVQETVSFLPEMFLPLACVDKIQWKMQHMVYDCKLQTGFSEIVCCRNLCYAGVLVVSGGLIPIDFYLVSKEKFSQASKWLIARSYQPFSMMVIQSIKVIAIKPLI